MGEVGLKRPYRPVGCLPSERIEVKIPLLDLRVLSPNGVDQSTECLRFTLLSQRSAHTSGRLITTTRGCGATGPKDHRPVLA